MFLPFLPIFHSIRARDMKKNVNLATMMVRLIYKRDIWIPWPQISDDRHQIQVVMSIRTRDMKENVNLATLFLISGKHVAWNAYKVLLWNVIDEENKKS